jgi:hypothetical protein
MFGQVFKYFVIVYWGLNCSILSCYNNILPKQNVFWGKARELLSEVKDLQDHKNDDFAIDKEESFEVFAHSHLLKELRISLEKLNFYNFSTYHFSSEDFNKLFNQIDSQQYRFLNIDQDLWLGSGFEKLNEIFDLMRRGICCELCFEHLIFFRGSLVDHLDHLLILIDYWKDELNDGSKLKTFFSGNAYKKELSSKIKNLFLLKDRIATFIGKVDEIFLRFFKELNPPIGSKDKTVVELCDALNLFVNEGIFCINNFFSEPFDPDSSDYSKQLSNFYKLSLDQIIKFLDKNNTNIQLIKENFHFQLQNYEIPSFYSRHWLMLSVLGFGVVVGGIYTYKNWDYLIGDNKFSFKNRVIKKYNEASGWVTQSFINFKDLMIEKFWPEMAKDSNQNKGGKGNVLKLLRENFQVHADSCHNNLEAYGVFAGVSGDGDEFYFNAMKKLKGNGPREPRRDNRSIQEVAKGLALQGIEFEQIGGDFIFKTDHLLNIMSENFPEDVQGGFLATVGRGLWKTITVPYHAINATHDGDALLKEIMTKYGIIKDEALHKQVSSRLVKTIQSLLSMVPTMLLMGDNLALYGQLWELMACRLIITALGEVEDIAQTVEVTRNWVRVLVPVLLVGVILPSVLAFMTGKVIKDRAKKRDDKISSIISEIYRILNYYNSANFDCYHHELRYKDQGLLSFWIEVLISKIDGVCKEKKERLLRLVGDLQNPDLSVMQKLDFVKLEWGTKLFGDVAAL